MLIYLNGTSSSGKTAIAMEFQKLLSVPCLYFSIDTILSSLAKEDLEAIMGRRSYRSPLSWDSIFRGYFSCVASLVKAENRVIADCPVYNKQLETLFNEYIEPVSNKSVVKIKCSLYEVERREKERGDRAIGTAKRQFDGIHSHLNYDLEIESDKWGAAEAAKRILSQAGPII